MKFVGRLVFVVVLHAVVYLTAVTADPSKPNIVLFMADDLGIGDVGCFGNDTIRTPNIDRIASEGVKLTHHLSADSLCTPSRAAFQTGRYPARMGMVGRHVFRVNLFTSSSTGLPTNETTFAEVAKRHDYSTALIGKWHLGMSCQNVDDFCHHPRNQGYDFFYGIPLTNVKDFGDDDGNLTLSQFPRLNQLIGTIFLCGMLYTVRLLRKRRRKVRARCIAAFNFIVIILITSSLYITTNHFKMLNSMVLRDLNYVEQPMRLKNFTQRLVNEGVNFLNDRKTDDKPFLLVMSWLQVHTALHTSDEFKGHSKHGAYGDNVEEMDWSVGEIVNALERLGMLDNTLVYFTSDNGGHLEERGKHGQEGGWNGIYRGGKGQGGMDGGIRMPSVMMWRGHIPPKSIVDVPTSLMDIYPTLSAAVWNEPPPTDRIIDGKNIYPLLTGKDPTPPHQFLFHYCATEIHAARYIPGNGMDVYKVHYATPNWVNGTQGCGFMCHCHGNWVTLHNPPLLFNIARDPSEKHPLPVTFPKNMKIIETINKAVEEHLHGVEKVPDQFSVAKFVPRPWLQPCCNFPHCDCVDPVYAHLQASTTTRAQLN